MSCIWIELSNQEKLAELWPLGVCQGSYRRDLTGKEKRFERAMEACVSREARRRSLTSLVCLRPGMIMPVRANSKEGGLER